MAIHGLDDLFAEGLRRLYAAHHQGAKQAGRNHGYADSSALRKLLKQGVHENVDQARRLEQVFRLVGLSPRGVTDPAMEGIRDSDDAIKKQARDKLARDLAIISAGQVAAHYYIAAYGTLREYARALGHDEAAQLLQQGLDETEATDARLSALSEHLMGRTGAGLSRTLGLHPALTAAGVVGLIAAGAAALSGRGGGTSGSS